MGDQWSPIRHCLLYRGRNLINGLIVECCYTFCHKNQNISSHYTVVYVLVGTKEKITIVITYHNDDLETWSLQSFGFPGHEVIADDVDQPTGNTLPSGGHHVDLILLQGWNPLQEWLRQKKLYNNIGNDIFLYNAYHIMIYM